MFEDLDFGDTYTLGIALVISAICWIMIWFVTIPASEEAANLVFTLKVITSILILPISYVIVSIKLSE